MKSSAHRWRVAALAAAALLAAGSVAQARARPPARPSRVHQSSATPPPASPLPGPRAETYAAPTLDGISEARARLARLDPRSPAAEVERWVVRMTKPGDTRAETAAALDRFVLYEPLIRQALTDADLPQDLAFVPLIESSYMPEATSHAGAAGLWQFMPGTARAYGLEVGQWVDERRDPVRSTYAAVRHLADLHGEFDAWHLAAAAYNAGGGRVSRALPGRSERSDGTYWDIRASLSRETRAYVPKLLAAARIGRSPQRFGFKRADHAPLRFRELRVPGGTRLTDLALRLGMPRSDLERLNPQLIRGVVPPGRTWPVRIPPNSPLTTAAIP
jgi:membrane-bound lytic murein transglycosylase D